MKAFKCDRCGKLFEYKSTCPGTNYDIVTNPNNSASCLDLCDRCFNKLQEWVAAYKEKESEDKVNMTKEKETLTVSKFIDILKNLPGDSPIVIVKDDSDDRHDGCYHVMEVAMLYSDYEEKNDAVGLSISNNPIELLSSNYNCTLYTAYSDTEE